MTSSAFGNPQDRTYSHEQGCRLAFVDVLNGRHLIHKLLSREQGVPVAWHWLPKFCDGPQQGCVTNFLAEFPELREADESEVQLL